LKATKHKAKMKSLALAGWQNGYAAACKAAYAGSIPASASKLALNQKLF
jgi:hypothetical protein